MQDYRLFWFLNNNQVKLGILVFAVNVFYRTELTIIRSPKTVGKKRLHRKTKNGTHNKLAFEVAVLEAKINVTGNDAGVFKPGKQQRYARNRYHVKNKVTNR
jgi:hypothetical protein